MDECRIERATSKYSKPFNKAVASVAGEQLYLSTVQGFSLESSEAYVKFMEDNNFPQYFAIANDEVVGWCDITPKSIPEFSHVGTLGMGVVADCRRKGLGRRLLEKTLLHARDICKLEKVELAVFHTNTNAIALYQAFGFEVEGQKKKARKLAGKYMDEIIMGKFI